ncbi:MAG: Tim44/TimA family putative adaptor protein [Pseudomonadota bacterium]
MDPTILIFAALALFLSYRLFNVLGTRGGHEPEEHERPVLRPVGASDQPGETTSAAEDTAEPAVSLPEWAKPIAEHSPGFEPKSFLEGAAAAYEMAVQGFADGDLSEVRGFLAEDVQTSFERVIEERTGHGQRMELTFVGVETPEVLGTTIDGDTIKTELRFRSEQVRAVRDSAGTVMEGSDEQVIQVEDRWTFARPVGSRDPNWTLIAT